jgi:tRNA(Ile)-lysidine synthase
MKTVNLLCLVRFNTFSFKNDLAKRLKRKSNSQRKKEILVVKKINSAIIERRLLKPNQQILVAISGGQDSVGLIYLLNQLQEKWNWNVGIVHCDHTWYSNSKLQALHVANLAINIQMNYYQTVAIQPVKKEAVARNWRYSIMKLLSIYHEYTAIVTAHSASDRVETLILNLIRGSGLNGLQSLSWKRSLNQEIFLKFWNFSLEHTTSKQFLKYFKTACQNIFPVKSRSELTVIRPMLDITRTQLKDVLQLERLPVWPDPSNRMFKIRRNRLRYRLLPYIRLYYNPQVDKALVKWAELVHAETIYLNRLTYAILSQSIYLIKKNSKQDFIGMHIQLLNSLPIALQRRILKEFLYYQTGQILSLNLIEKIRTYCLVHTPVKDRERRNVKALSKATMLFPVLMVGKIKVQLINQFLICSNRNRK